jgi:hypothetical protein
LSLCGGIEDSSTTNCQAREDDAKIGASRVEIKNRG